MPATDTDFEREFAELVAQLREVPAAAPESLRARVRALGEPEAPPTLRDHLATIRWRRAVLLAAPACLAVLLSVAAVRGLLGLRRTGLCSFRQRLCQSHPDVLSEERPAARRFHTAPGAFSSNMP